VSAAGGIVSVGGGIVFVAGSWRLLSVIASPAAIVADLDG